jgi:hypothetical protein
MYYLFYVFLLYNVFFVTLSILIVIRMFRSVYSVSLCYSVNCLCVEVYWTTATGISGHFSDYPNCGFSVLFPQL